MKKIITAIGNKNLNEKLKTEEAIEIIGKDIQYQEGIFEILEKERNIDFLILSEKIVQKLNIIQTIEKIKLINRNIKIIFVLEKKEEELENVLISKGIYKIIYHNQIEIKELIHFINNETSNENEELKKEINNLKKLIIENAKKSNIVNIGEKSAKSKLKIDLKKNSPKEKVNLKIKELISKIIPKCELLKNQIHLNQRNLINRNLNQSEIISISGPSGVGKSIITVNLAKSLIYQKEKILMIDFDVLNNSLHTILGVKKYPQKIEKEVRRGVNINVDKNKINNIGVNKNEINDINVENYIVKINKKIDLISITSILFETKSKLNFIKIQEILNTVKEKYDTIIIDTSSECFFDITKNIIQLSTKNIFVTETNVLEIKKAKELLNIYINEWKIKKEKFNILFNKYDKDCIDFDLLKCIFCEFNIVGFLKYNTKYNKLINKNIKNNFCDKKIRSEYIKINNKI